MIIFCNQAYDSYIIRYNNTINFNYMHKDNQSLKDYQTNQIIEDN